MTESQEHSDGKNRTSERGVVSCDENCGAFFDPQTFEEYVAAYEHWRHHDLYMGCSHCR